MDFKIKDKLNNSNPPLSSMILIDLGDGYNHITIDQIKSLINAALEGRITTAEQAITSLDQNKSNTDHVHTNATSTVAGFMSTAHYTKLENITELFKGYYQDEAGLNSAHPSGAAGYYAYVGTTSKTTWIWDSTLATPAWVDTGVSSSGDMLASIYDPSSIGADAFARVNHTGTQAISTVDGLQTALAGKEPVIATKGTAFNKDFGTAAGTVAEGSALAGKADSGHTHANGTQLAAGFLSTDDKTKLDGIAANATNVTVDSALSNLSTNPVQNKVVKTAIDNLIAGTKVEFKLTKVAHGFVVGDIINNLSAKALADTATNAEVVGIVSEVIDVDNVKIITGGKADVSTWKDEAGAALQANKVYYLSPTTAGKLTLTEPTTVGHISKPVLVTLSTSVGVVANFRGDEIAAESAGKVRHDAYTALTLSGTMAWDVANVAEGKAKITIPSGTAVTDIAFSLSNAENGFVGHLPVYNNDTISHTINLPTGGIYEVGEGLSAAFEIPASTRLELNFAYDGEKIAVTGGLFVAI